MNIIESVLTMLTRDDHLSEGRRKNISELYKNLCPHRFLSEDDIYGRNNILMLLSDPSISDTQWPTITKSITTVPFINLDAQTNNALSICVSFYEDMMDNMIDEYVKVLMQKGVMKSYEEITKKIPLIDITSCFEEPDTDDEQPDYSVSSECEAKAKQYGWYSLIPCFKNVTIRVNKRRFLNIETLKVNRHEQTVKLRINDYFGSTNKWMISSSTELTARINDDLSFEVSPESVKKMRYEDILNDYIPDMNWDKKHQQLWRDVFGLYDLSKDIYCEIRIESDFDDDYKEFVGLDSDLSSNVHMIMPDTTYCNKLKNAISMLPLKMKIEKIMQHEEANSYLIDVDINQLLRKYGKMIVAINGELYLRAGKLESQTPDKYGRYKRKYNQIFIHSEMEPMPPRKS